MANQEVSTKVYFVGVWCEDIFTDDVVKNIAGHASVAKAKKVKVTLNKVGLKLTRSKFLKDNKSDMYPLSSVKTVFKNPNFTSCVMFILDDHKKKYRIIALRCLSDMDAVKLANFFTQIKKDHQFSNIELKKRENGNWTLRERSAHNANRHLAEVFNETIQPNGNIILKPNGDAMHVPVLDRSKVHETDGHTSVYVKRNSSINSKTSFGANNVNIKDTEDEYTIETEVIPDPQPTRYQHANGKDVQGKVYYQEMKTIKPTVVYSSYDHTDGDRPLTPTRMHTGQTILPSKPTVYTSGYHVTSSQPVIYRAPPKTYEARVVKPAGYQNDPWAAHKRVSGNFFLSSRRRVPPDTASVTSSIRARFDNESIKSESSRKSLSLRSKSSDFSTTIPRSIEDTYARPLIIRRHGSAHSLGRARPMSYHVMGKNELVVYQARDTTDVPL